MIRFIETDAVIQSCWEEMGNWYVMDTEFQLGRMGRFSRRMVVIGAQQCGYV